MMDLTITVAPEIVIERPAEKYSVHDVAVEQIARLLCKADGIDPDSDWRISGSTMLTVYTDKPQSWHRYEQKAETLLRQAFSPKDKP